MLIEVGDNRKMEEYTDGGNYYSSPNFIGYTSPGYGYVYPDLVTDIVRERIRKIADTFDYRNEKEYYLLSDMMSMSFQLNDITRIVDDAVNQYVLSTQKSQELTGPMRSGFYSQLTIAPTRSDYERVADEVILDAIKNGIISTNAAYSAIKELQQQAGSNTGNEQKTNKKNMSKVVGKVENPLPIQAVAVSEQVIEKPVIKKVKKFKVGERYLIYPMKNKQLRREYVVKKTVYAIKDREVNIVIMKQVKGPQSQKFTLNKEDCLKLHIKYEEGLEVFSMELDWKLIKNKE